MPSCAARCAVAAELRADNNPTLSPARCCAQTIAVPSLISKRLLSVPSAWSRILPSVSTPSTSNRISLILDAFAFIDTTVYIQLSTTEDTEDAEEKSYVPFGPLCPLCPPWWRGSLKHLRPPQIVEMNDACNAAGRAVDDDDRGDLALFHDVERFGRQRRRRNRHRPPRHHVGRAQLEDPLRAIHVPAQVAVGDDAEQG